MELGTSQITLLQWLTFLLGSLTANPTVQLFRIYLFLLVLVFVLQCLPYTGKLIMFLSQLSLILPHTHKEMPRFIAKTILMLIDSLCDHLRDVPWQNIFKLNASAAASELCKWFQVEIDPYIPHCTYQVLSLIISIVLENLFHLNQQNKPSESIYLSIYLYINLC